MKTDDLPNDSSRGQTPQDFAVGISIFLLTVMFVFAFVPSVLQPSQASEEVILTTEGDRVASNIVSNLSVPGRPNHLNESKLDDFVTKYKNNTDTFRYDYGLGTFTDVNVTIRKLNGFGTVDDDESPHEPYRFGEQYQAQDAVVVERVVTMDHPQCQTGCKLIVRLW
jgi:hypothetical protein